MNITQFIRYLCMCVSNFQVVITVECVIVQWCGSGWCNVWDRVWWAVDLWSWPQLGRYCAGEVANVSFGSTQWCIHGNAGNNNNTVVTRLIDRVISCTHAIIIDGWKVEGGEVLITCDIQWCRKFIFTLPRPLGWWNHLEHWQNLFL